MQTTRDTIASAVTLRPTRRIRTIVGRRLVSTVHAEDTGWETLVVPRTTEPGMIGWDWRNAEEWGRWDSTDKAERMHGLICLARSATRGEVCHD